MKKYIALTIAFALSTGYIVRAQAVLALQSDNNSSTPRLQWYTTSNLDSTNFIVYRTGIKKMDFKPILPLKGTTVKGDTLIFWIADTTLTEKALYKYFITLPYKNDTLIRSEIIYGHNMGYIPSPQIVNFKAESAEDKKAINLSWQLNYNFTVNTISLYRSTKYDDGYELIARLSGDAVSYTDLVQVANEAYYYYFIIHDYFGYQRPSVRFHGIAKYSEKPISPKNFELTTENDMVHLSWERLGNNIVGYRVYRKINHVGKFVPVTNMFYTENKKVEFIDSTSIALKDKDIEYYAVSVSDGFLESDPSEIILYHMSGDVIPGAPEQCDFVIDSLNRIMLIWTAQDKDPKVKGYNVYKIAADGKKEKLNKNIIPYNQNYFTDEKNNGASITDYEIETVSITNTPSINKTPVKVGQQRMPQHLILSLNKTDKGISVHAVPLINNGIKEIILLKQITNTGSPKQIAKLPADNIDYTDINVKSGEIYSYSAIAVYKDNSQEVVNAGVAMRY